MKKLLGCVLLMLAVGCGSQVVEFANGPDQEDVCDCDDAGDTGVVDPDTGAVVDGGVDVVTPVDSGSDVVVVDANDSSVDPDSGDDDVDSSVGDDSGSVVDSGVDSSGDDDSSTPDTGVDSSVPVVDSGCHNTCRDEYNVCVAGCVHNRCSVSKSRCIAKCTCTLEACLSGHGLNDDRTDNDQHDDNGETHNDHEGH